ncbi:MAG TPA: lmo0937 family membrane protein [Blastocatellia bacterium]|nr:lmo0937 family membrane protein [Blastocatellia bacterium]
MLWTIFTVLLILWFVGLISGCALGGLIHVLLALALIVLIFNLLRGRRAII